MNILFWNVDTQRDFILPTGKLYIEGAEEIVGRLQELTTFAEDNNIKVVNTADFHTIHSKEISDTPDFKTTFPEHCMFDSEGHDFISQTYPKNFGDNYYLIGYTDTELVDSRKLDRARNIVILKDAFDVFEGNPYTDDILRMLKPDLVVVYGISGDYCVDYAIKGLRKYGYPVVAIYDAIKSIRQTPFEEWVVSDGVIIMSADTIKWLISEGFEQNILK